MIPTSTRGRSELSSVNAAPTVAPTVAPTAARTAERIAAITAVNNAAARRMCAAEGKEFATQYLASRGVRVGTLCEAWSLGYAQPGWSGLTRDLLGEGFALPLLVEAGLSVVTGRGSVLDLFRDRIMFPIRSVDGDVVGFTGRDLSGDAAAPKYLNTPMTPLFDKSAVLLGLYEGLQGDSGAVPVIVEGPLDVMAVAARDGDAAIRLMPLAVCGTSFTPHHAARLRELTGANSNQVVVAMDGDMAGRAGAVRAGEVLRSAGLLPRIADLGPNTDPCQYLSTPGSDLSIFTPDAAHSLLDAQVSLAIERRGEQMQWVEGRLGAARELAAVLRARPPRERAAAIGPVSVALGIAPSTMRHLVSTSRTRPSPLAQRWEPRARTDQRRGDRALGD